MIGTIQREIKNGEQAILSPVSAYNPSEEIKKLTNLIASDFELASTLQNTPFTEFNDQSLISRMDLDQKRWNAYHLPQSNDVDEAWRWNGVRPITRNKIIGIVAQMTSRIIMPAPFAQNDKDEMDRVASEVMGILMEYNIRHSNYVDDYINWLTDSLVNPKAYLGVGFFEQMQTIRDNEGKTKDVLDELMSGFQTFVIPCDEVLITNYYQRDLQRQRAIFRRRYIDIDEAESKWGEHSNWQYIRPGIIHTFDQETTLFYEAFDQDNPTLVEEVIYFNRLEDTEIPFVNGVYFGEANTEANPIKHRDSNNRPKYNLAALGYEPISSRFFYDKSAAWKLGDDDELVIRMEQLTVDGTFLSVMPATITSGVGQLSEAIVIPGKNTAFENENVKVTPIQLGNALQAGWNAILKKERDISESTQDPLLQGVSAGIQRTATESALLAQNAKIALGRFGNMLAISLKRLGELMIDVIVNHQTVAEVEELLDGKTKETYKTFVLADKESESKVVFQPKLMGETMMPEQVMNRSRKLLKEAGGPNSNKKIFEVNPEKWRKLKFFMHIDVDELIPSAVKEVQRMNQELMQQQIQGQIQGQIKPQELKPAI